MGYCLWVRTESDTTDGAKQQQEQSFVDIRKITEPNVGKSEIVG